MFESLTLNWYALPNCPEGQLKKGKFPTDTGYDLKSAETIEIPTYQMLKEQGLFSYQEMGTLDELQVSEELVKSNPSLKMEDGIVYRIKYKVPLVRTGVVIKFDQVAWSAILPRSGTPKLGLIIPNSIGVIDYEYSKVTSGEADELRIQLISLAEPTLIFRGERLAQLIPQYYVRNQINPTSDAAIFSGQPRGGFNSSGSF